MLLGIEPRHCKVCKEGLYRDKTFFTGGWSRCTLCDEFVHYSCLASGKVSFLKVRPRVCKTCRAAQEGTPSPSPKVEAPVAVGSRIPAHNQAKWKPVRAGMPFFLNQ